MKKNVQVALKNGEQVQLVCKETDDDGRYKIEAFNSLGENVAYTTFRLKGGKVCYLSKIEITNIAYSHQCLGTKMLKYMECFAREQYCRVVDGRFYPFGDLGCYTRAFYIKNGYTIDRDGYDIVIYKRIDLINEVEHTF